MNLIILFIFSFILAQINAKNIQQKTTSNMKIPQTNLLFIIFDDLRPELSIYGRKHMITPNFERLANRSVIFDLAITQIAVCNPARDSLLTGLRPDTTGTYGFQSSFFPNIILPTHLVRSGYNTAGIGKVLHWDGNNKEIWNYHSFENGWYEYQNLEREFMNSSTMPDKVKHEHHFRDYIHTTRAIEALTNMSQHDKYFMLGMGFKLPHLAVHVPHKYYEMYKGEDKIESWKLSKKELKFPPSSPSCGYRCCAEERFLYMKGEGSELSNNGVQINNIQNHFTSEMHNELMQGYCAAVTFVDTQLGRILDKVDELDLWHNLTIVLTADHGMHNGEKGIWEKWTLFDEATRVPLLISHPLSPHNGQHYTLPVETIDIFPTLIDILGNTFDSKNGCGENTGSIINDCKKLQGKSLAPVILGKDWKNLLVSKNMKQKDIIYNNNTLLSTYILDKTRLNHPLQLPMDNPLSYKLRDFAISQVWYCAPKKLIQQEEIEYYKRRENFNMTLNLNNETKYEKPVRSYYWRTCNVDLAPDDEMSILGYSMRTIEYRYTAWFHFDRVLKLPMLDTIPFKEELYDHRGDTLASFTHKETINLANKPPFKDILRNNREILVNFIRKEVVFKHIYDEEKLKEKKQKLLVIKKVI